SRETRLSICASVTFMSYTPFLGVVGWDIGAKEELLLVVHGQVGLAAGAVGLQLEGDAVEDGGVVLAQSAGDDGEGVGDAVLSVLEGQLGHRAQRGNGAVAVPAVH